MIGTRVSVAQLFEREAGEKSTKMMALQREVINPVCRDKLASLEMD